MAAEPLLAVGIVFVVLAAAGTLSWRFGQSAIPAYLVAGILVGPHGPRLGGRSLTLVEASAAIDLLAELGIILLLFFIGVEFSIGKLISDPGRLLRAGGIDLLVNGTIGVALGLAFGLTLLEALFLAGIVYPSSSAVITKSLLDLGWIADPETETVLGVLVIEDLVMAVYLAVLAAVALGSTPGAALTSLAESAVILLALSLLATVGTDLLGRLIDTRSDELFLLRIVGLTTLLAGVALATGVSEAVAAFFVGAAVSETHHKDRIETVLSPLRDLFAPVFFFGIGLATDPRTLLGAGGLLLVGIIVSVVGKLASGYLGGQAYGLNRRRSIRVALSLVARGEFSLVVATLAVAAGTGALGTVIPPFAVGYVLVMSILGTVLMRSSGPIERRFASVPSPG